MLYAQWSDFSRCALFPQAVRQEILQAWQQLKLETPPASYQLQGELLKLNLFDETTKASLAESSVEIHRQYVDIQAVLSEEEDCYCLPPQGLQPRAPFDEGKDFQLFQAEGADLTRACRLTLRPGWFAVFLPGEGHLCAQPLPGQGVKTLRKAVFKVDLSLLVP